MPQHPTAHRPPSWREKELMGKRTKTGKKLNNKKWWSRLLA